MAKRFLDVFQDITTAQPLITPPAIALRSVTSKSGLGVYASSDTLFKGAVFGRDSLEVADDLLELKPQLVSKILLTLASLQGTENNPTNEEEPGKNIHEYRNIVVDGKQIDTVSMTIFTGLSSKWGGNNTEMRYYGSIDATPHFLRTLGNYRKFYGDSILQKNVTLKNGDNVTVKQAALNSANWLLAAIEKSNSGLLEYQKRNPQGISNQVWKDSEEFYVHENGENANHSMPISSIEVQGLAYDGLVAASKIFSDESAKYIDAANTIRDTTIKLLWQPHRESFALGTDYDESKKLRVIHTSSANQAALLDTGFFEKLAFDEAEKYTTAIIKTIFSHEFLTDAGIRSRALSAGHLVKHWDYHGSYVSWPKETYDIAKGMRRQGYHSLARQLENRVLNVCLRYKGYPEFVYVDAGGRVMASPPTNRDHGSYTLIEGTNKPEHIQAWTVSAVTAIVSSRIKAKLRPELTLKKAKQQSAFEQSILQTTPYINRYINPFTLTARYPSYPYKLLPKLK